MDCPVCSHTYYGLLCMFSYHLWIVPYIPISSTDCPVYPHIHCGLPSMSMYPLQVVHYVSIPSVDCPLCSHNPMHCSVSPYPHVSLNVPTPPCIAQYSHTPMYCSMPPYPFYQNVQIIINNPNIYLYNFRDVSSLALL